jgi:hypothetical protein
VGVAGTGEEGVGESGERGVGEYVREGESTPYGILVFCVPFAILSFLGRYEGGAPDGEMVLFSRGKD